MVEFIERNGYRFEHPSGGLMETAEMIEKLAGELVTEEEFSAWLADRISGPYSDDAPADDGQRTSLRSGSVRPGGRAGTRRQPAMR